MSTPQLKLHAAILGSPRTPPPRRTRRFPGDALGGLELGELSSHSGDDGDEDDFFDDSSSSSGPEFVHDTDDEGDAGDGRDGRGGHGHGGPGVLAGDIRRRRGSVLGRSSDGGGSTTGMSVVSMTDRQHRLLSGAANAFTSGRFDTEAARRSQRSSLMRYIRGYATGCSNGHVGVSKPRVHYLLDGSALPNADPDALNNKKKKKNGEDDRNPEDVVPSLSALMHDPDAVVDNRSGGGDGGVADEIAQEQAASARGRGQGLINTHAPKGSSALTPANTFIIDDTLIEDGTENEDTTVRKRSQRRRGRARERWERVAGIVKGHRGADGDDDSARLGTRAMGLNLDLEPLETLRDIAMKLRREQDTAYVMPGTREAQIFGVGPRLVAPPNGTHRGAEASRKKLEEDNRLLSRGAGSSSLANLLESVRSKLSNKRQTGSKAPSNATVSRRASIVSGTTDGTLNTTGGGGGGAAANTDHPATLMIPAADTKSAMTLSVTNTLHAGDDATAINERSAAVSRGVVPTVSFEDLVMASRGEDCDERSDRSSRSHHHRSSGRPASAHPRRREQSPETEAVRRPASAPRVLPGTGRHRTAVGARDPDDDVIAELSSSEEAPSPRPVRPARPAPITVPDNGHSSNDDGDDEDEDEDGDVAAFVPRTPRDPSSDRDGVADTTAGDKEKAAVYTVTIEQTRSRPRAPGIVAQLRSRPLSDSEDDTDAEDGVGTAVTLAEFPPYVGDGNGEMQGGGEIHKPAQGKGKHQQQHVQQPTEGRKKKRVRKRRKKATGASSSTTGPAGKGIKGKGKGKGKGNGKGNGKKGSGSATTTRPWSPGSQQQHQPRQPLPPIDPLRNIFGGGPSSLSSSHSRARPSSAMPSRTLGSPKDDPKGHALVNSALQAFSPRSDHSGPTNRPSSAPSAGKAGRRPLSAYTSRQAERRAKDMHAMEKPPEVVETGLLSHRYRSINRMKRFGSLKPANPHDEMLRKATTEPRPPPRPPHHHRR